MKLLLEREEVLATRKSKSGEKAVNIRPMILDAQVGQTDFELILSQEEGNTCKPSMVLEAVGKEMQKDNPPRVLLTRTHLMTRLSDGTISPLEDVL